MPSVNPFISFEDAQGSTAHASPVVQQQALPSSGAVMQGIGAGAIGMAAPTTVNAAGTSENVALHVAVIVALAMVGVYVLRATGFKFVVAGSVGR